LEAWGWAFFKGRLGLLITGTKKLFIKPQGLFPQGIRELPGKGLFPFPNFGFRETNFLFFFGNYRKLPGKFWGLGRRFIRGWNYQLRNFQTFFFGVKLATGKGLWGGLSGLGINLQGGFLKQGFFQNQSIFFLNPLGNLILEPFFKGKNFFGFWERPKGVGF